MELVTGNAAFAEKLLKIMRRFRLPAKITDRKGDYLVYIKEGNGVAHFLQYVGAAQAYLTFEEVRVVKEMRNNVNRVVNCETANLQKPSMPPFASAGPLPGFRSRGSTSACQLSFARRQNCAWPIRKPR